MAGSFLGGLFYGVAIGTVIVWGPIHAAYELVDEDCPCNNCCFVWIEEADGEIVTRYKPSGVEITEDGFK